MPFRYLVIIWFFIASFRLCEKPAGYYSILYKIPHKKKKEKRFRRTPDLALTRKNARERSSLYMYCPGSIMYLLFKDKTNQLMHE